MTASDGSSTLDTNVAIYALSDENRRKPIGKRVLAEASFVSVQLLNELANVLVRKQGLSWADATAKSDDVRLAVQQVRPISAADHMEALRIAARYQLSFYDALMLAVALAGGARTIYSEDMQHDLLIDGTLRIVDPFR